MTGDGQKRRALLARRPSLLSGAVCLAILWSAPGLADTPAPAAHDPEPRAALAQIDVLPQQHGVTPAEPTDAAEPSPEDPASLPTSGDVPAAPEAATSFEIFTVPRTTPLPQSGSGPSSLKHLPAVRRPPARTTGQINGTAVLTLFPGLTDLWLNVDGQLEDQSFNSHISLIRGLSGGWDSLGQVRYRGRGLGLQYGNTASDVLVGASGLRVFSPWGSSDGKANVGVGLYNRLRGDFTSGGMVPALDINWQPRSNLSGGLAVAADSSFRVVQTATGDHFSAYGFFGRDTESSSFEHGIRLGGRITGGLQFRGSLASQNGERQSRIASVGLAQRVGRATLSFDHQDWDFRTSSFRSDAANLLLPSGRWTTSLRLERFEQTTRNSTFATNSIQATAITSLGPSTFVWLNTNANFVKGRSGMRPNVAAGVFWRVNDLWSFSGEVRHFAFENVHTMRLGIGRQLNQDWNARLLIGPSYNGWSNGTPDYAVGLQLTRYLRYTRVATGTIQGKVLLDGQPLTRPLTLFLDTERKTRTNSKGLFTFRNVPVGPYGVALDLTSIPVELHLDQPYQMVTVEQSKRQEIVFNLRRVTQIRGVVTVGEDSFGRIDPTAAIGVVLTAVGENGERYEAMADHRGAYVFGALSAGKYRVRLDVRSIPQDFEVVGPVEQEIVVELDRPATLGYHIQPKRRKIELSPIPECNAPGNPGMDERPEPIPCP